MKIAQKLTAVFIAGVLVIHGISAAIMIMREKSHIDSDIERDERVLGRSMSRSVARVWKAEGEAAALALVDEANERNPSEIRWIWLDVPPGDRHAPAAPADVVARVASGDVVVARDEDAVYTYVPTSIPGDRVGAIEVTAFLDEEDAFLKDSVLFVVVTGGALALCCSILAWAVGRALVGRPVDRLLKYARRVEAGDLTQRLVPASRDELGELSTALSEMCEGLARARDRVEAETRERLRAIEQVRHTDRLATVGTLAAGVAHELGTPINVIEGHAQLIREDRVASPAAVQNAAIITKQCKRMAAIIRELLRFARRVPPTGTTIAVLETTRETLKMCEVLARKRGVTTTIDGSDELTARIGADPMQQILTNVVMNGIQAMPSGGELSVRLSRERTAPPGGGDTDDYVRICVADTGIGMDEATRQRIFEPFFTTKDVGEGTGLGLSVALGIARDHHGWIDVASEPGRGSAVSIYIPSRPAEPAP